MYSLRTRIKQDMISCIPWKIWKYEIRLLPISSKTLFANKGIEIEKLEEELKLEGYIHNNEILLEILKNPNKLKKYKNIQTQDYWTKEDFEYYEEQKISLALLNLVV